MRVITRCVIDMRTGRTLAEESFEYTGPIARLGGSSAPETQTVHQTSTEKSSPWKPQIPYIMGGMRAARKNLRNPPEYFPGRTFAGPSDPTQAGMQAYGNAAMGARGIMGAVRPAAQQLAAGNGLGMGQLQATSAGKYLGAAPFMQAYGRDIMEGV